MEGASHTLTELKASISLPNRQRVGTGVEVPLRHTDKSAMSIVIGLVASTIGSLLIVWGMGMLVDYRRSATRYWEWVYNWHERYIPLWRSTGARSARRTVVLRIFGGTMSAIVGLGWLFGGVGLLVGYWK